MNRERNGRLSFVFEMLVVFLFAGVMFTASSGFAWDEKTQGPPWPSSTPEPGWQGPLPYMGTDANGAVPKWDKRVVLDSWGWGAKNPDEIKDLVPWPLYQILQEPEVWGHVRVNKVATVEIDGTFMTKYREGTEKYKGQPKIVNDTLVNYNAGCPFPDPKTGLELVYNSLYRPKGCDKRMRGVTPIVDSKGHSKYLGVENVLFYFDGRASDPNGLSYKPNPRDVMNMQAFPSYYPYDLQGLIPWRYRYRDPTKYDDMWMYLPSLRRVRRMSASAMEDKLPGGQDVTWDLMDGIGGKESQWDWKLLGRKKMLYPVAKRQTQWIEGELFAESNGYYQLEDLYILEGKSRDPHHNVQKIVRYILPEIWACPYLLAYDKKGELYMYREMGRMPWGNSGVFFTNSMTFLDMQRRHATFYIFRDSDIDLMITPEYYLLKNLKRQYPSR